MLPLKLNPIRLAARHGRQPDTGLVVLTGLPALSSVITVATFALCLPWVAPVWGQTVPMAAAQQSPVFSIRGFKVTGENPLADGETSRILAPFLRADATLDTLQNAATALEASLRQQGFSLHRVSLPPQEVGDTIALHISSFKIGKVEVVNDTPYSDANVRQALPELREGSAPFFPRLSIQNAMANESLNRRLSVVMRESETAGEIDATVRVKGERPWAAGLSLSNGGSPETGRDRFTLVASHGNLWDRDHAVDVAYTTSLQSPSAVRQLGATYKVPLYSMGGVVTAGLNSSTVKGDFGAFTTNGAGSGTSLAYLQHLGGSGSSRHFWQIRVDDKLSRASSVNGLAVGVDRRSRPLTLGYLFKGEANDLPFGIAVDYSVNSPTGAGNNDTAYQLEDPQRPLSARWRKWRLDANFGLALPAKWLLLWRGQAQYSSAPLISSEQISAGGQSWLRGAGSVFGDRGMLSALDVYSPEIVPGLRGLIYLDLASLGNSNGTAARPGSDFLSSAGFGLRYNHTAGWYAALDYAQVIKGSVIALTTNTAAPQRGDSRLYVTVGARF